MKNKQQLWQDFLDNLGESEPDFETCWFKGFHAAEILYSKEIEKLEYKLGEYRQKYEDLKDK